MPDLTRALACPSGYKGRVEGEEDKVFIPQIPSSLLRGGSLHVACASEDTVARTLARVFAGMTTLIYLIVDVIWF
jgi:hypothetical protein